MNRKILLPISFFLVGLLIISSASAQMPGDDDRTHPRERPMTPHHSGFEGGHGDMTIIGDVAVNDAIVLTLSVEPSEQARTRLMNTPARDHMPRDLSNMIRVSIYELVEFEDSNDDGYTENDTEVSSYALNSENLQEPVMSELENGTMYTIDSVDNTITMYIYLNEKKGIPHSWKWSVDLNYEFTSNTSELAIIQEVVSNGKSMARSAGNAHHHELPDQAQVPAHAEQHRQIHDNHANLPMFLKWDNTAIVDDEVVNITTSLYDNGIAISIPQGDKIFYDPEVGVEVSDLEDSNSLLQDLLINFIDIVNSPTILGLTITIVMLIGLLVAIRKFT